MKINDLPSLSSGGFLMVYLIDNKKNVIICT